MNQAAIGSYIARKRKEKNLTQEQLAEHIGASNKTISKWENGKYMPDYSILQKLCNALHVTLPERMDGEDATEGGVLLVVLGIACNAMSGMISGSEVQELISVLLVALSVAEISAGIFERNTDLHTVFGANLMWYLQFHVVCARLPLFVGIPKRVVARPSLIVGSLWTSQLYAFLNPRSKRGFLRKQEIRASAAHDGKKVL